MKYLVIWLFAARWEVHFKVKTYLLTFISLFCVWRNLLFETSEAEIKEMFSQFGEITYSKIVVDPATEHPKGK